MDEIATISISLSIASLGIFFLFFNSNDDDDQDGGQLMKTSENIIWFNSLLSLELFGRLNNL